MIFLIESIVACVLFTLMIKLISHNRQEVFTNDYPPVVTDKLREQGLIAEKPPARKKDIIRKLIAIVVYAVLFSLLLRYINGIETFCRFECCIAVIRRKLNVHLGRRGRNRTDRYPPVLVS